VIARERSNQEALGGADEGDVETVGAERTGESSYR
jgi:hypothetical protein